MGQLFALGLQELDKTISTHCLIISEVAEDTEKIVFFAILLSDYIFSNVDYWIPSESSGPRVCVGDRRSFDGGG